MAYFPPVDLREWVGKMTDKFPALAFDPKQAESISPLLHVSPVDPPTLLIHGDADGLVKLDNSERILAAFKKEHVPCDLLVMKGAGHGFTGEQGNQASVALIAWFDKYLAPSSNGKNGKVGDQAAPARLVEPIEDSSRNRRDLRGFRVANPQPDEEGRKRKCRPLVAGEAAE